MSEATNKYPAVITTADVVILTMKGGALHVLVHKRTQEPYNGALALPGGYVHADQDTQLSDTVARIMQDKLGMSPRYSDQFYTFADATRDPRGWSMSVAHFAMVSLEELGTLADGVVMVPVANMPKLAFDHNAIVARCVSHVRNKAQFSALPCYLLPETFTLAELQNAYEQVTGITLNASAFRRKLQDLDFLEPVQGEVTMGKHRPAQKYQVKPGRLAVFDKTI